MLSSVLILNKKEEAIMHVNLNHGYTKQTFKENLGNYDWIATIGDGPHSVREWDNNKHKYTNNIIAKALDFYVVGAGIQRVKLPADFNADNITDLSKVELVNPVACIVRNNIYVKADGVRQVDK